MNHALVIGGTGMLRGTVLGLAHRHRVVYVIARRSDALQELAAQVQREGGLIEPIGVDYRESRVLASGLRNVIARHGPIDLVVSWIHSDAPDAARIIAEIIAAESIREGRNDQRPGLRWFDVLGSATADPDNAFDTLPHPARMPDFLYRSVVLGFVPEGNRSRWLTHDEISGGVLSAIEADSVRTVIGRVRPWSLRPGNRF